MTDKEFIDRLDLLVGLPEERLQAGLRCLQEEGAGEVLERTIGSEYVQLLRFEILARLEMPQT